MNASALETHLRRHHVLLHGLAATAFAARRAMSVTEWCHPQILRAVQFFAYVVID